MLLFKPSCMRALPPAATRRFLRHAAAASAAARRVRAHARRSALGAGTAWGRLFGARRCCGEHAFRFFVPALRTRLGAGAERAEDFEGMPAFGAEIFIKRHGLSLVFRNGNGLWPAMRVFDVKKDDAKPIVALCSEAHGPSRNFMCEKKRRTVFYTIPGSHPPA